MGSQGTVRLFPQESVALHSLSFFLKRSMMMLYLTGLWVSSPQGQTAPFAME